ncbi:helix-turn-helix domain-containing protein [Actinophytocola oryzae]|nr:helix-turn-helix transcriptional regulator [Actinophytocola oryzae]
MRPHATVIPAPRPATVLGAVLVLLDLVALLLVLPIPAILLLAPTLVPGDRIDLGVRVIDTPGEAWLAAAPGAVLLAAIVAVAVKVGRMQRSWVTRMSTTPGPARTAPKPGGRLAGLTDRENQVLALMSRGLVNRAIAEHLFISEATVRKHVGRIFAKLDVDGAGSDRRVRAVLTYVDQSTRQSQGNG